MSPCILETKSSILFLNKTWKEKNCIRSSLFTLSIWFLHFTLLLSAVSSSILGLYLFRYCRLYPSHINFTMMCMADKKNNLCTIAILSIIFFISWMFFDFLKYLASEKWLFENKSNNFKQQMSFLHLLKYITQYMPVV